MVFEGYIVVVAQNFEKIVHFHYLRIELKSVNSANNQILNDTEIKLLTKLNNNDKFNNHELRLLSQSSNLCSYLLDDLNINILNKIKSIKKQFTTKIFSNNDTITAIINGRKLFDSNIHILDKNLSCNFSSIDSDLYYFMSNIITYLNLNCLIIIDIISDNIQKIISSSTSSIKILFLKNLQETEIIMKSKL